MMWKIELPANKSAIKELETALTYVSGKSKYGITETEKRAVKKLYGAYELASGVAGPDLDSSHLSVELLEAIEDGSNEISENGRLKELRNRILLNAKLCPCCGLLIPDEIDHYLPASKFQVYGVYSSNLIPYCHKCNRKKSTVTGIDPNKRFIHVYYEDVPDNVQFMIAKPQLIGKGLEVSFEIIAIPELSDQLYKQLNFQLKKVGFDQRVAKELNIFTISFAAYIQSDYESGGTAAVKLNLRRSAKHHRSQFGINHWKPVILDALADYDDFCDGGFYEPLAIEK